MLFDEEFPESRLTLDYAEIAAHGVMSTPALAIDDKVVSVGRVLLSAEIETLLQAR
ncbi:MAG: thioredoxin family protein [Gammaproteobacteria bacterium]|nr:thioredoxin family protein [Gammaproteobacteria bacterium]MBU1556665.1 thioredoxin family protein [Gammaproteobacteria bacterium]MBU2072588.1 thioredoxin family protein [Gammaproteobacteria bacterium]MBU2184118.1 thioredoxin family protein [Gammaproteobacteria bacterium]MBU2206796.1 thioredoxin family protein [Gammaproteobacteria bacterium]